MNLKKSFLFTAIAVIPSIGINAIEVKLEVHKPKDVPHYEIPVTVDVTGSRLNISINRAIGMTVVVTGPDGIVYQKIVTADNVQAITVDLANYTGGEYTIYFTDTDGNQYEGDFTIHQAFDL